MLLAELRVALGAQHSGELEQREQVPAKELEQNRANFVLFDGSPLSHEHPAWAKGRPKAWPTSSPQICVAYMPGYGLVDEACDFDISSWGAKSIICEGTKR